MRLGTKIRKDGRFIRISQDKVDIMRRAKQEGYSLREVSVSLNVAKSTVSLYTRDLFYHPNRIYQTEEEARNAVYQRNIGKDHTKYRKCIDCGDKIRNEHVRCLKCNLVYQRESGNLQKWVESGVSTQFQLGNLGYQLRSR